MRVWIGRDLDSHHAAESHLQGEASIESSNGDRTWRQRAEPAGGQLLTELAENSVTGEAGRRPG